MKNCLMVLFTLEILQVFPNPSHHTTTIIRIREAIDEVSSVVPEIRTVTGESIETFPAASPAGWTWDGRDDQGRPAAPGVYPVILLRDGMPVASVKLVRY